MKGNDTKSTGPPSSYVVIGTSAGGVAALIQVFRELPPDLPAAILVVMHVYAHATAWLAERLSTVSRMPVLTAEDGRPLRAATAYVAPPGHHLLVNEHCVRIDDAPPEQHYRPSIDVLFRSAASVFGPRVIGVVLTGMLRDGALGLRAVHDAGGLTIVQNPQTAEAHDMPFNALQSTPVDYCLDLPDIGPTIELLVRRTRSPDDGALETGLAASVRLMKQRARLLAKLRLLSRGNPKTERFLAAECGELETAIEEIQRLIVS